MSLATNLQNAFTDIASEFKKDRAKIGDLSTLATTSKTNLVAAINEVLAGGGGPGGGGDVTTAQMNAAIATAVASLVDTAPGTLDTLNELAAAIGDNPNFSTTMTNLIATKANSADVVLLTGNQTVAGTKTFSSSPVVPDNAFTVAKVSGLQTTLDGKATKTEVGDTTTDFVATFQAGLL